MLRVVAAAAEVPVATDLPTELSTIKAVRKHLLSIGKAEKTVCQSFAMLLKRVLARA